jgi:hypothetical protein
MPRQAIATTSWARWRARLVLAVVVRPCEHAFVTSQGHAYIRSQRALLTKNVRLIDATARKLQHLALEDALRILVVLAETRDERVERGRRGSPLA